MTQSSMRRTGLSTGVLLAASAATLAALLTARPHLSGSPVTWGGDELAYATTWLVAVACAAWLTLITIACMAAIAHGRRAAAQRIARWAPPVVRRILQGALVSTWALVPAAAYALPSSPIVLHVGPGGRLTTIARPSPSTGDPVVRAPQPTIPPPTSMPAPLTRPSPRPPLPVTRSSVPTPAPTRPTKHAEPPASPRPNPANETPPVAHRAPAPDRTHLVRAGDNLWRIARAEVAQRAHGTDPADATVAGYWRLVIAANRSTLRSGDPSLIFPGEIVTLP